MLDFSSQESYQFQLQITDDLSQSNSLQLESFYPQDKEHYDHSNQIYTFSTRGHRTYNFDQIDYKTSPNYKLVALYDGHVDGTVALHLKNNLLTSIIQKHYFNNDPICAITQSFKQMEEYCLGNTNPASGSTALLILCTRDKIIMANIGDSISIGFVNETKVSNFKILNSLHQINNQQQRQKVKQKGGIIMRRGGCDRLLGDMNLSRCIGNRIYKKWMSSQIEIKVYDNIYQNIVIGSDGVREIEYENKDSDGLLKQIKKRSKCFKDNTSVVCFTNPFYTK